MRAFLITRLALFAIALSQLATIANAGLLTAQNLTMNVGQNGTLNVTWSSTQSLNYLNTQFVLRAVTGSTSGAVFTQTAGVPPMPPITASNYLFSGNSSAVTAGGNPASVGMDAWANDSYFLTDATDNGLDYLQNGSRLMQLETGIPIEMLLFIQSLVIAFIAAPDLTLGILRNPFQSVLRRIKK